MKVVKGVKKFKAAVAPVLTLGNFDGVHLGHQKMLKKVTERAAALKRPSAVYTFEPHPLKVVSPGKSPPLITAVEDKIRLIGSFGIDYLILAVFTKEFASKHPEEFVEEVIVKGIKAKEVWVGHDFSFGRLRRGTAAYLKEMGRKFGFKVFQLPAYKKNGIIASSSLVREYLKNGDVKKATGFLGRPFSLKGHVVKGRSIGINLGFPTANISTENELIPRNGVYAVYASLDGKTYPAVANIGLAPTFKRRTKEVEIHILDFTRSIYGKNIEVFFVKRIRDELRFGSAEKLADAIRKDISMTKRALKGVKAQ